MNDRLAAQGIRFREFRFEDIPAMVDIRNRTTPDDPRTVERTEYFEKTYPPDNPRLRFAVENAEGKFIGQGVCEYPFMFVAAIERAQQAGFEFTQLVAERAIQPEADRLTYELDAETRAEVPWPGGARSEMTYEQYRQRNFDAPDADPSGILIAKYQGRYAGLTSVRFRKDGMAHTMMTGVRREYRGQGLALALKLLSFRLMKERGYLQTLTNNDTDNPSILHLNEKLGYQKRPGDLQWEKLL